MILEWYNDMVVKNIGSVLRNCKTIMILEWYGG